MKKLFFLLVILSSITGISQPLNVMSFNIRLNIKSDSLNSWPYRKDMVASQVLFHETHILGVQEALHEQMIDLKDRLPSFKYIGTGRDDGKQKGEYSAIFYDSTRLQLIKNETFWLSETPTVPGSKSWDAAITRIVTWGKFRDRKTKVEFFVFNTHFDHMGKEARRQSALLIRDRIGNIAGKSRVILTGDFNSKPSDDPIKILTDTTNSNCLKDTKSISKNPHYGPTGSFNAFQSRETSEEPIDFIFIKNGGEVLQHANLSQTWMGRFSSDHFPVFARIEFKVKSQKSKVKNRVLITKFFFRHKDTKAQRYTKSFLCVPLHLRVFVAKKNASKAQRCTKGSHLTFDLNSNPFLLFTYFYLCVFYGNI